MSDVTQMWVISDTLFTLSRTYELIFMYLFHTKTNPPPSTYLRDIIYDCSTTMEACKFKLQQRIRLFTNLQN